MLPKTILAATHGLATAKTICVDSGNACDTGLPTVSASSNELQVILQILFAILAAIAVLFVVVGGLRFVFSEGNPEGTTKARNTIIYAVVGLVIAISAEAIVSFALKQN